MGEPHATPGFTFRLPANYSVSVQRLTLDERGLRIVPLGIRLRLLVKRAAFASRLIGLITASVFTAPRRAGS